MEGVRPPIHTSLASRDVSPTPCSSHIARPGVTEVFRGASMQASRGSRQAQREDILLANESLYEARPASLLNPYRHMPAPVSNPMLKTPRHTHGPSVSRSQAGNALLLGKVFSKKIENPKNPSS